VPTQNVPSEFIIPVYSDRHARDIIGIDINAFANKKVDGIQKLTFQSDSKKPSKLSLISDNAFEG
jgi:hypothetical protein